jgi:hypothetical protein
MARAGMLRVMFIFYLFRFPRGIAFLHCPDSLHKQLAVPGTLDPPNLHHDGAFCSDMLTQESSGNKVPFRTSETFRIDLEQKLSR